MTTKEVYSETIVNEIRSVTIPKKICDELGVENPVSSNERAALVRLRSWADRVVELTGE